MDGIIHYLNCDLDLASPDDLTPIAAALQAGGVHSLHVTQRDDSSWIATFETDEQHTEPDSNIAAILTVIESLDTPLLAIWNRCTKRDFNIGYDCGLEPWEFNQAISPETLERMGKAGGTLRITIYPERSVSASPT